MGSGKSTIAKRLADALGMNLLDLDRYIEEQERRTITKIFKDEGEAGFRGLEKRHLHDISEHIDEVVVATGGGTPCFYDNMVHMNNHGLTIYLEMDAMSLAFRLENFSDERPLLVGKNYTEIKTFVKQHLEERRAYYQESQLIVNALGFDDKKLEALASDIANYSK